MNTTKVVSRQSQIDRHLRQNLGHWASKQAPSLRVRRELMQTVRHEAAAQGHFLIKQPSDAFIESMNLGPIISFNHCFSMFYSLHARVRL